MERSMIINALEFCTRGRKGDDIPCPECPYNECNIVGGTSERQTSGTCQSWLMKDAIALIKELTEENERLKNICNSYALQYGTARDKEVFLRKEREYTVREFAERLKEAPIKVGLPLFGLATKNEIEDYANGLMLQMRDAIDRIAEEMLKLRECPQCKHFVGCEPSTLGVCDMYEEEERE